MAPDGPGGEGTGADPYWDRVGEVFEGALAVPPAERAAFLDRTCPDPAVRAEVEGLLAAQPGAEARFEHLGTVARTALADLGPEALPQPGARIGPYRVEGVLGAGGMGTVVRAFDDRLERPVALKFLHPAIAADATARARLLREARAAAALDHPHIGRVHAVEDDAQRPFLVLALYEGETLRDRLRRGPLPPDDALAVAEQTAGALDAAHRAGVVHRDLKPGNVFLVEGEAVDVRLLDFGIARVVRATALTRTGGTPGTAGYMAPEQVRGEGVGPPADLWALGVVLHEMLTGRRPFAGESEAETVYAVLEKDPPSLDRASVPAGVAALVGWLLDKRPERRPTSAAEVEVALRSLGAGAESVVRRPRRPPRRWAWAVAALVVAALGALAVAVGDGEDPLAEPSAVAVMPFAVRGGPEVAYLREGLVDLLSTGLDGVGGIEAVDPNAVLGLAAAGAPSLDEARRLARQLGAGHFVLGRATDTGGGLRLTASLYRADGTEEARAQADALADALLPALDDLARQLVAGRLGVEGQALASLAARTTPSSPALRAYLDGEQAMRETRFDDAEDAFAQAVAADSAFALAWYRLARAAGWTGDDSLNAAATMRAVALADALPARTREALAGYQAFRKGQPDEAEQRYRAVLARAPADAETWQLLGELLFHYNPYRGRPAAEARVPLERARALALGNRELLPHLIELAARRGDRVAADSLAALYLRGDAPAAPHAALRAWVRRDRRRAADLLRQSGPEAAETALLHLAPAVGDPAFAEMAASVLVETADPDRRATGHLALALLRVREGRWDAARPLFDRAARFAPDRALVLRALAAAQRGAPSDALARARREVEAWRPPPTVPGLYDGDGAAVRRFLAGLLDLRQGRRAEAERSGRILSSAPRPLPRSLGQTLQAALALDADQPARALALLDAAQVDAPFPVRRRSPLYGGHVARALRAQALARLGRCEEAARWDAALYDGDDPWGLALPTGVPAPCDAARGAGGPRRQP